MYDNPFAEQLNKMEATCNAHATRITALNKDISWYQGYQSDKVQERVSVLAQALLQTDRKLQHIDQQIKSLNITRQASDADAELGFDPRYWLSSKRKEAKLKVEKVSKQLAALAKERVSIATPKTNAGHDMRQLHAFHVKKLHDYRNFDVSQAELEISKRDRELTVLAAELEQLRKRKSSLGKVIDAKWAEMEPHVSQLAKLESDMQMAEYFSDQLNAPGANKAAIHQACESKLGDGSPGRIKSKLRSQIEREKRVIQKFETVIKQAIKRSQTDIREIIIDGNNMAYDKDNSFRGMAALDAIIPLLKTQYKVTIFYDPQFNQRLGLSPAALRNRYPGVAADMVPNGTNADYYLLKFAADKPYAYVISNDKYDEFGAEPAVRQKRILRHSTVHRCIAIPFLEIEANMQ